MAGQRLHLDRPNSNEPIVNGPIPLTWASSWPEHPSSRSVCCGSECRQPQGTGRVVRTLCGSVSVRPDPTRPDPAVTHPFAPPFVLLLDYSHSPVSHSLHYPALFSFVVLCSARPSHLPCFGPPLSPPRNLRSVYISVRFSRYRILHVLSLCCPLLISPIESRRRGEAHSRTGGGGKGLRSSSCLLVLSRSLR